MVTGFRDVANRRADHLAVKWAASALTYGELLAQIDGLKRCFQAAGLGPGSVIALHLTNVPAFLGAVIAAVETGATIVPIDPMLPKGEREALVWALRPTVLLTQSQSEVVPGLSHWQLDDLGHVVSKASPSAATRHEQLEGTAFVQWSSGSSGRPKGILISASALWARAQHIRDALELNEHERTLCAVPLTHSHGLDCLALPTLLGGGTVWLMPPATASPMTVLGLMTRERISFFSSVPSFFAVCNRLQSTEGYDLSALRRPFCGSAALSRTVAEGFLSRFGRPLQQGYGLAEIGVICMHEHQQPPYVFETVGRPMNSIQWRLEDSELVVSSPALCSGYWVDGAIDSKPFVDRTLRTGDLVSLDDAGRFFIVGRLNQFINVAGQKVNPVEIETALQKLAWVKECAVIAAPDELTGECVSAYLVTDVGARPPGDEATWRKAATAVLREQLSDFKIPRHWHFREALPKSPLGKVLKPKLAGH